MRALSAIHRIVLSTCCLFVLTAAPPLLAQSALPCSATNQAAATLLLPHFEVDVESTTRQSTLFSVGNTADTDTLAHAVVWTNWGHPVLSFDFFIPARGLQTFSVRDILLGQFPETTPPTAFAEELYANCSIPLELPEVDTEALLGVLRGEASATDGLCYASAEGGSVVTGYITVDVVQDCSGADLVTPLDHGYLGDCASGLAGNDNVLWGDFFLVNSEEDSAQGERMVALVADQERFGSPDACVDPPCSESRITETFHGPEGNRMPLAKRYETRFLKGGGFDGGTDLLVWVDGKIGPLECGLSPDDPSIDQSLWLNASFRSESGVEDGAMDYRLSAVSRRVPVGETGGLDVERNFGCVELGATRTTTYPGGSFSKDRQLLVVPLLSAAGRYSLGLSTLPVADFCTEE